MGKLLRQTLFSLSFGCSLLAASDPVAAAIKCWTNKEGITECGNTVPPEYAQHGHEERNAAGAVKKLGPAKTQAEVENERVAKAAADKTRAEAEAAAKKQAAADKVLLDTFSSEDDMVLARDGQTANIESQVKLTESRIAKLQKGLDNLITQAADLERRSKPVPEQLTKDIADLRVQIADNKRFIADKHKEQTKLHDKFDADLKRFRELRSAQH
ncbi:MAG: hypothetical protein HYX63_19550 [Gammaproteobacteria bacterium]|nr:hypothetical protein [Gammaproteobacteria bacterium]